MCFLIPISICAIAWLELLDWVLGSQSSDTKNAAFELLPPLSSLRPNRGSVILHLIASGYWECVSHRQVWYTCAANTAPMHSETSYSRYQTRLQGNPLDLGACLSQRLHTRSIRFPNSRRGNQMTHQMERRRPLCVS